MKTPRILIATLGTALLAFFFSATGLVAQQQGLLFGDTFDRPASTNMNESTDGKAGSLGALDYVMVDFNTDTFGITNNTLTINAFQSDGNNGGLVYVDHNFIDSAITDDGAFSVSVDLANYATAGSGRRMSIGVGQSTNDLAAQSSAEATGHVADLLVSYRNTNVDALEIYNNGVLNSNETVTATMPNAPVAMRVEYTLTDFNAGSTVNYEVFFDDSTTSFTSGSFTWGGTDENYISLSANLTGDARFDNLAIRAGDTSGDITAPTPNPMTWVALPTATDGSTITMTATTAFDWNGVEYFFSNTTDVAHSSGWQESPTYTDTGLTPGATYSYMVVARDLSLNTNGTSASTSESATTPIEDHDPPTPNPLTWVMPPTATFTNEVTMIATNATDLYPVEYYFSNTTDAAHDSGWQTGTTYIDTGLTTGVTYTYVVVARDLSENTNVTAASSAESATPLPDAESPTPDPMTWATPPIASSSTSIVMTATSATDPSGVEYYFAETSGNPGGDDSGWQDNPSYTDDGLTQETMYTYTVQARDKSPSQNATAVSAEASATTLKPATPIAGVDFENADDSAFDRTPDDLEPGDGISVSADWSYAGGTQADVKADNGANAAGTTSGSYVAKLNGGSDRNLNTSLPDMTPTDWYYSWSITIPADTVLNLQNIRFDLRQGTGTAGNTRWAMFNTSLDGGPGGPALWGLDVPPLRSEGWANTAVDLSGPAYQGLSGTTVTFYWYNEWSGSDIDTIVVTGTSSQGPTLSIAVDAPDDVILTWTGHPQKVYDVEETLDLAADPVVWDPIPSLTNLTGVLGPMMATTTVSSAHAAYYRLQLFDGPTQTVYASDFEGMTTNMTDWTWGSDGGVGTAWELGTPTTGPDAANSGTNCWGTNLDDFYDSSADVWLRSPVIDLSTAASATLKFWNFKDVEDYVTLPAGAILNVLDATGTTVLQELARQYDSTTEWTEQEFRLTGDAVGQPIMLEFRFFSDEFVVLYYGWYVDDVSVTVP